MEEKTKRIGEFGDNQMKGINLVVKGAAKKYNFITGWELADNWDKWPAMLAINLIVDLEKVGKFYDVKMSDYWLEEWYNDELIVSSYILTMSNETNSKSSEETRKINDTLKELYEILPDQFSTFYEFRYEDKVYEYKCFIQVHHFQNKPTQKIYYSI